jgi:hypothetical protein
MDSRRRIEGPEHTVGPAADGGTDGSVRRKPGVLVVLAGEALLAPRRQGDLPDVGEGRNPEKGANERKDVHGTYPFVGSYWRRHRLCRGTAARRPGTLPHRTDGNQTPSRRAGHSRPLADINSNFRMRLFVINPSLGGCADTDKCSRNRWLPRKPFSQMPDWHPHETGRGMRWVR